MTFAIRFLHTEESAVTVLTAYALRALSSDAMHGLIFVSNRLAFRRGHKITCYFDDIILLFEFDFEYVRSIVWIAAQIRSRSFVCLGKSKESFAVCAANFHFNFNSQMNRIFFDCVFVYNSTRRFPFSNCLLPQATGYARSLAQCAMIAMWHSLDQMRKYLLELAIGSFTRCPPYRTRQQINQIDVTRGALY